MTTLSVHAAPWVSLRPAVKGAGPAWLSAARERAWTRWTELGLPSPKHEEWRLTKTRALLEYAPEAVAGPGTAAAHGLPFTEHDCHQVLLVNGRLVGTPGDRAALPEGVTLSALDQTGWDGVEGTFNTLIGESDLPFAHLNTALFPQLLLLRLAAGAVLDRPLHLLHLHAGPAASVAAPRLLVLAGRQSQATVIEQFASADAASAGLTSAVAEYILEAGAQVDHYRLQHESAAALHLGATSVSVARDALFRSHAVTLGAAFTRNDVHAIFTGENAECTLNGLYMANGRQVVDNHTALDHAVPRCNSFQVYKGILDEQADGVFNGKIFVRPDAQKTDAKQTNRALLLSGDAHVTTKPQLEIFADDVKCTHGATVGQIDEEAVHYLRSRGIGEATARAMLTHAFAGEALADVRYEPFMPVVERLVHRKFHWTAEEMDA